MKKRTSLVRNSRIILVIIENNLSIQTLDLCLF